MFTRRVLTRRVLAPAPEARDDHVWHEKTGKGPFISKARRWVEEALPPEHRETMVMVNELQCFEPGCAPLETVENNPIMFKLITEPFCTCACLTNRLSKSTSLCASL